MFFSIITVVYNDLENLKKTINSVQQSLYDDYEHLVIDGGSTDGTIPFLSDNMKTNKHLRFYSGKDNGIYDAMNKGVTLAKGEYVHFLNAADIFYSDTSLQEVHELLSDRPDVLYGQVVFSSGERKGQLVGGSLSYLNILLDRTVAHQSVFARRELLLQYPFDLKFKYEADQVFMIQIKKGKYKMKYVKKTIASYDGLGFSSQPSSISGLRHERYATLKRFYPLAYFIRQTYYFLATGKILDLSQYEARDNE